MKKTPPEIRAYITEIAPGHHRSEIAEMTNAKFGTHYTAKSIAGSLKNWGLRTGLPSGLRKGEAPRKFTVEIEEFILANYRGTGYQAMANLVNERFGTGFSRDQIKYFYCNHKLNSGLTGRFEKGHTSWNKGAKGWCAECSRPTQFKKGHMPANHKPIGYERESVEGYIEVKVREKYPGEYGNGNFVLKHRKVWEETYGPIPEGNIITFRDGNRKNCDPENLIMISKAQNAVLNHKGIRPENPEYLESSIILADLIIATAEKKKQRKGKKKACESQ